MLLILPFFWLVFIVYWAYSAKDMRRLRKPSKNWFYSRIIFIAIIFVLVNSKILTKIDAYAGNWRTFPIELTAVILTGVGISFAVWARRTLGKNWGMPMTERADPELVTSGPYAYVRHPIYTGMILAVIGSGLAGGAEWLILCFFIIAYFVYSAFSEEKYLTKEFPAVYAEYKRKTKMLIPFIF